MFTVDVKQQHNNTHLLKDRNGSKRSDPSYLRTDPINSIPSPKIDQGFFFLLQDSGCSFSNDDRKRLVMHYRPKESKNFRSVLKDSLDFCLCLAGQKLII